MLMKLIDWSCDIFLFLLIWKLVLPILLTVFNYTIGKRYFSKRSLIKKAGDWAIVTGSSSGIGRAYAMELAKESLNILLISNDREKLNEVAKEINATYQVQTKIFVTDFTQTDIYEELKSEIDKLSSVACLVNNVGMGYNYLSAFTKADFINLEFIKRLILCNDLSTASMTHIALQKMLLQKRSNNTKPVIINIGSASGKYQTPYLSLYSASKAFMLSFANCLMWEKENEDVCIQLVYPNAVQTELSRIPRSSLFVPKPEDYAKSALDMFGVEDISDGYFLHSIQGILLNLLPKGLKIWLLKTFTRIVQKRN